MFLLLAATIIFTHDIVISEKFTGKCWVGTKEEGYSQQTCLPGQLCSSIGCSYGDGGTRYVKQCVDQGPRAQGCPPDAAQTCNAIGGGKHKSCRKCDRSDLCNDELDEGEDPSEIVVPENESEMIDQIMKMIGPYFRRLIVQYGSKGNKNGVKCNVVAPPAFEIKQTTLNCVGADKCGIINMCGVMTVGLCMPEETCGVFEKRGLKAQCELLKRPYHCDTCDGNFCNGPGPGPGGEGSKTNNGSEGMNGNIAGDMMLAFMAVVATLINLYTGVGHFR